VTSEERRVEHVRRRLVEAAFCVGVNFVHAKTHLHRSLIVDLIRLAGDYPDPPMRILDLFTAWGGGSIGGGYEDFVTYAKKRIRS